MNPTNGNNNAGYPHQYIATNNNEPPSATDTAVPAFPTRLNQNLTLMAAATASAGDRLLEEQRARAHVDEVSFLNSFIMRYIT
jgi:hypothetical protein